MPSKVAEETLRQVSGGIVQTANRRCTDAGIRLAPTKWRCLRMCVGARRVAKGIGMDLKYVVGVALDSSVS